MHMYIRSLSLKLFAVHIFENFFKYYSDLKLIQLYVNLSSRKWIDLENQLKEI